MIVDKICGFFPSNWSMLVPLNPLKYCFCIAKNSHWKQLTVAWNGFFFEGMSNWGWNGHIWGDDSAATTTTETLSIEKDVTLDPELEKKENFQWRQRKESVPPPPSLPREIWSSRSACPEWGQRSAGEELATQPLHSSGTSDGWDGGAGRGAAVDRRGLSCRTIAASRASAGLIAGRLSRRGDVRITLL